MRVVGVIHGTYFVEQMKISLAGFYYEQEERKKKQMNIFEYYLLENEK